MTAAPVRVTVRPSFLVKVQAAGRIVANVVIVNLVDDTRAFQDAVRSRYSTARTQLHSRQLAET